MKTLYDRQEQHVRYLCGLLEKYGSALDSSETGTGKTVCGSEVARVCSAPVLVVCPKAVIPSWERELKERGIKNFNVINYEKLRTGKTKFGKWTPGKKKWLWTMPESLIIFDEAHKCSGAFTQNAKMLIEAKDNHAVLMLSATIANNPLQMRAAGWVLGSHMLGNYWQWCFKYGCSKNRWNGVEFTGTESHIRALGQSISHRCARMTAAELADHFAETQIITEPLAFGEEIDKIYAEMEKELTELEEAAKGDSTNKAAEALVAQLRARQRVELLKVPFMVEMADDLVAEGKSVAIFVNFKQTLEALTEKLGITAQIHGDQTAEERQRHIDSFQNDQDRTIVCNIAAGGVGISLHDVTGKHPRAAIISPSWNEKDIIQVIGRVHRAGGKTPSMQRILFAAGTVEERVQQSVNAKIKRLKTLNEISCADAPGA
jgi:superfamily II DNA or RNA helicase